MTNLISRASSYYRKYGFKRSVRLIYRRVTGQTPWNILGPRTNNLAYLLDHQKSFSPKASAPGTQDSIESPASASKLFGGRFVLIIGDLNLPQCKKYRVVQKVEALEQADIPASYSHWLDIPRCMTLMQTATAIILYRVKQDELISAYCNEARRLGIPVGYDIDDPIFDVAIYGSNNNLNTLKQTEKDHLLSACASYAAAFSYADFAISSTPGLAKVMAQHFPRPIYLWRNAIDKETRHARLQAEINRLEGASDAVRIGYASGSRAHDADFSEAEPALLNILSNYPQCELSIIGYHTPSKKLKAYSARISHVPYQDYSFYLQSMASFDISIVPLLPSDFNECKSAIRFLESAIVGVPAVCSRVGDFTNIIRNGRTGYLAATTDDWYSAMATLVTDASLRQRMGQAAQEDVTSTMYSETIVAGLDPALLKVLRND